MGCKLAVESKPESPFVESKYIDSGFNYRFREAWHKENGSLNIAYCNTSYFTGRVTEA